MLEEKIVKFLSEILNAESATISEGGGGKWSEVREYLVSGLKSKQTEDVMTKEQMQRLLSAPPMDKTTNDITQIAQLERAWPDLDIELLLRNLQ